MGEKPKLVPGKVGQFEVFVDGQLVVEKDQVGLWAKLLGNKGIPSDEKVLQLLKKP